MIVGNYTFNPEERSVTIYDNIAAERFFLITNVTDGIQIFNFANPNLGFDSVSYDALTESTTISLKYDTSTMSSTDKIQILIEDNVQYFAPEETFLDPVSKIRVSTPGNLIDTDFEYSLQGTKWETIQTVNNIPTVYSNSGDVPIEGIDSVIVNEGSKQVQVITTIAHNLNVGDPISVQGLDTYLAEGFFIVSGAPDSLTFFFELDAVSPVSGDISGSYTTIIAAKFFEGSPLPVSIRNGAVTDFQSPSTIDVITDETHGFSEGTKVYLRNTIGPKELIIDDSSVDPAPDGRPFVDTNPFSSTNEAIDATVDTGRGTFRTNPIVTYDWESTYTRYLIPTDIDTVNDYITWPSHGMNNKYTLLFNTPIRGSNDAGLIDGYVYWVEVIDTDRIRLHSNSTLTSIVNLTPLLNVYGLSRLGLVYRIFESSGNIRNTEYLVQNRVAVTGYTQEDGGQIIDDPNTRGGTLYTTAVDVTAVLGGNPTNVRITEFLIAGDFNSTAETITVTIGGLSITSRSGFQSGVYQRMINDTFSNFDVSSILYTSGGRTFFNIQHRGATGVNDLNFFSPSAAYRINMRLENLSGGGGGGDVNFSGADFAEQQFGLGGIQPNRVIAFQGRSPGSYSNSTDLYSFLPNQRTNARYGATNPFYNESVISTDTSGSMTVSYNNSNTTSFANSEIFYCFANILTSFRNTIYIPNHGVVNGTIVDVTVDSADYSAGQRFKYSNANANEVVISQQQFSATVNVVSTDLIRLQIDQTPFTDDISGFPENFTISFLEENPTYNTIYINNHKITGTAEAVYTRVGATAIGGLTSGTTYLLNRVNDSRLSLGNVSAGTSVATTSEVGAQNNNTQTLFIDFETALGFAPTVASIQGIEFRGDFGNPNEYVLIRFGDGDEHFVGQRDGEDTSIFIPDTTWSTKNVTTLLTTNGGGLTGINIEFDPTSQINAGFFTPSGNFWEIRFIIAADSGTVVLSSSGSGQQVFTVSNQIGAYDGIYTMTSIPAQNEFVLSSDFTIPKTSINFTTADINVNTITFANNHNFITGEQISYLNNGNSSMFPVADSYYAIVVNNNSIQVASSYTSAINGSELSITPQSGTHTIESVNIIKGIPGAGSITVQAGNNRITGSGTNFLTDFKRFDQIWIELAGFARVFTVDQITTNTNMTLFETPVNGGSSVPYYFSTQMILRPDGFSLHRPFDGGVDITAGTSPNSKIVRQSRKYFRYQSGKGIQNSFAINFNPPKIVQNLIQSAGTTATVNTQELHRLSVGDQVTIEDATVSTGVNTYNGTFVVTAVNTPFQFEYEMDSVPTDTRAGGFPTYSRATWNDSFIRAGMFDDQNGFFYEYDGQNLYAVRRSSTLQLAGTINVTRGSQVIIGNNTSFTEQLSTNQKIVIRGQSYLIVEVSSDSRLVVQPAYRGISATKVKITKTIDTRIPQNQWNLDKCDGTGPTGYILDINRIQMAYADYSWYGAGKVRFGFKDQNGHVKYIHEFRHNNRLNESYFRSGNLPARYEIENGPNATAAPTLFHFGTSIIMDGRFDDDKAYLFSSSSKPFSFTNGASRNVTTTANSNFQLVTIDGSRVFVYAIPVSESDAQATSVGSQIVVDGESTLPEGTYVTQVRVDGANSLIYTSWPATATEPSGVAFPDIAISSTLILGEQTPIDLTEPLPLLSLRLAPSVDSGLTGAVGEREIINRMQLGLQTAGVTSNTAFEVFLILNTLPSNLSFIKANSPSLCQLIKHNAGDTLINGVTIFSQKSSAGSVDIDLTSLLELGNSISGGDGIFPAGPDLLTLAVQPQDTSQISGTSPFFVSGKINWSESQA